MLAERGERSAAPVAPRQGRPRPGKLSNLERIRRIEQVIESVRPDAAARSRRPGTGRRGWQDRSTSSMTGACAGCQMESVTLAGIQQKLRGGTQAR
ncbi:MAG: NifU family protein [Chromatiales bacterium]|nr:NifU family protein [Chromatiales bacterium]